jgi:hypothetical protein
MTTKSDERKARIFALMERYNQVGSLLPEEEDLDLTSAVAVAEAKIILAEMAKVKAELDEALGLPS